MVTLPPLLIDVGVGQKVEEWLRTQPYDVKIIRDLDPRMADIDILNIAVTEKRLIITMDKDFGELVYKSRWPHQGVLLLRLDDERAQEKIRIIDKILSEFALEITGRFSVFKNGSLRTRE